MGETKNLNRQDAIEKLQDLVEDGRIGMLCTNLTEAPFNSCPMSTQTVDDDGIFWFFSSRNSQHNQDIKQDKRTQLLFSSDDYQSYLSVYGTTTITEDRAIIDKLWKADVKIWFPEGKEDPNLTVLKFTPDEGFYWDTKNGKVVSFLKMAASLVTGKTMDDSRSGELNV